MFISSQIKHLNNIYYILITFFLHLLNIPILKSYHPTIMLDFSYRQSCFAVLVKMKKVPNYYTKVSQIPASMPCQLSHTK